MKGANTMTEEQERVVNILAEANVKCKNDPENYYNRDLLASLSDDILHAMGVSKDHYFNALEKRGYYK
jgi:hypothetical protein